MNSLDYVIFGILILVTFAFGLIWIITKGSFVKYNRDLDEKRTKLLAKRSILAGVFYIATSLALSVACIAMTWRISWLMVVCFVLILTFSVAFIILSRIIYWRKR